MLDDDIPNDPLSQPEKLLTLLSLGGDASPWNADELGAIVVHQLDAPLRETFPEAASERLPWNSLRTMLHDPATPVCWLERLKRIAKAHSVDAKSGVPRDVATALYLAAIVVARRGGHALTKLDEASLRERVAWAANRAWIDSDLRTMFADFLGG